MSNGHGAMQLDLLISALKLTELLKFVRFLTVYIKNDLQDGSGQGMWRPVEPQLV